MHSILDEIADIQRNGGLRALVGRGLHQRQLHLYPVLSFVIADNMEAQLLAGVKGGQTRQPCRICMRCREDLSNYHIIDSEFRSETAYTAGDETYLKEHSYHSRLQVLVCILLRPNSCSKFVAMQHAFVNRTSELCSNNAKRMFELFPPDMLHTLLGGAVRYTVLWTLEVIKVRCNNTSKSEMVELNNIWQRFVGDRQLRHLDEAFAAISQGAATDSHFKFSLPQVVSVWLSDRQHFDAHFMC